MLAVGADIAHVGAAATRDRPVGDDFAGREIEDRDAARPAPLAAHIVRAAVDDVQLGAVAAWVQAVGAGAGRDVANLLELIAIHQIDAVGHHVGDEEHLAVRRDADVLRHATAAGTAKRCIERLAIGQHQIGLSDQIRAP